MSNKQKHGVRGCLFIFIAIVYTGLIVFVSLVCGGLLGQSQIYHRDSSNKIREISKVLESNPDRYSGLHVRATSAGRALIVGAVESQEDRDNLTVKIAKLYGEKEGFYTTAAVDIRPSGKALGTGDGTEDVPEEIKKDDRRVNKLKRVQAL